MHGRGEAFACFGTNAFLAIIANASPLLFQKLLQKELYKFTCLNSMENAIYEKS